MSRRNQTREIYGDLMSTELEKFKKWFDDQGVVNFHASWNYAGLAEKFGGEVLYDEFGFERGVDFSKNPNHDPAAIVEYLAGVLNKSIASAKPLLGTTDLWDNVIETAHPDYNSFEERLQHVRLVESYDIAMFSAYCLEMICKGYIIPSDSKYADLLDSIPSIMISIIEQMENDNAEW